MLDGVHFQNAYVTRNFTRAVETLKSSMTVRKELFRDTSIEVVTPRGRGQMELRIAFLWVGGLQYEIIEPVRGMIDLYREALPDGDSMHLHHICMRVADWPNFRAEVERQPLPIALELSSGALNTLYLDARPELGHYLEYSYIPDDMWKAQGGV